MKGETPIQLLPATSSITIKRLITLGILTYEDLLNYFPFRYENYSRISSIGQAQPTEKITLKGRVITVHNEYTKNGKNVQKVCITDGNLQIKLIWFNQPFIIRTVRPHHYISVSGTINLFARSIVMQVEHYEIVASLEEETIHTGRLVPIYPEIRGLSSRTLREKMWYILTHYTTDEIFPPSLIAAYRLMNEKDAYLHIHFPYTLQKAREARHRLSFDELTIIQLASQMVKNEWKKEKTNAPLHITQSMRDEFIHSLPFALTHAQKRALGEITKDLAQKKPMNRLLQGEVGSGKTVIAAASAWYVHRNKGKTLILAPTEILAQQHYVTLQSLFTQSTLSHPPTVALYTASSKPKKNEIEKKNIIVGTHALLSNASLFSSVGLVIVDEQHKFGVTQRAQLKKKGISPHLLTMTATPIPRTIMLTLYGELDISVIDELPAGRIQTKSYLVANSKRESAYTWIKKQIQTLGIQTFIVCPLIDESDKETLKSVKAAKNEFNKLQKTFFRECRIGLLHGKMKSEEKNDMMYNFAKKNVDILISTPVVEVGIDIPNATIIIIEASERFGLAQLHQLRGRVGRGDKQSYCFLFTEKNDTKIAERLKIFTRTHSGFELAEHDLKIRGTGELYGVRQHGASQLKIADVTDFQLIKETKKALTDFLQEYTLHDFPVLQKRLAQYTILHISRD
ncbi:MAG TPA: ATP-dependent DNA helicase RecG [Patescibacteria group bacterium]|nr:ATP-dependent DNA helicase RecG [Patescibacteria group bacterium]